MVVSLQPGLADGVYTVAWRTLSADDGHSESGAYRLVFGTAAGAVGVTQPQSSAAEFSAETALGRWWLYLAASLVFGPLLAWQIVFRPLLQGGDSAARLVAMGRTRPLVLLGTLALVAGTLYAALAQAASATGLPLWSVGRSPAARRADYWPLRKHLVAAALASSDLPGLACMARHRWARG